MPVCSMFRLRADKLDQRHPHEQHRGPHMKHTTCAVIAVHIDTRKDTPNQTIAATITTQSIHSHFGSEMEELEPWRSLGGKRVKWTYLE
eukprot:117664-Alexandrium_andersonii.AAC.1